MDIRSKDDFAIAERAAAWIAAVERGDEAPRAAFAAWLKESPRHVEEALFAAAVAQELKGFDRERRIDIHALLTTHEANVVPLAAEPLTLSLSPKAGRGNLLSKVAAGIAALAMGATAFGWWQNYGPGSWRQYQTALGEQRAIELSDGSLVHLNTQSRIDVRFGDAARDIRFVQGEALFKVHHDPARPFRVHTDRSTIQAIGTQFDVYRRNGETRVSVIEGRVRISTPQSPPRDRAAGEGATISTSGAIAPQPKINALRVTAWRQRRLIFQADTLEDIAAEFNRYNRTPQIRIEGDAIRHMRFTGVFDADDPESLGLLLGRDRELAFEKHAGELIVRQR